MKKKEFSITHNVQEPDDKQLFFRISSGLKSIIGKDLITNDFVAIFELVKNSFDAKSSRVDLIFEQDKIWIIDNGKGMSFNDLKNKWLFVAYSAKKDGTEDFDYRNQINSNRRYAGSKGVGRFSCDRLGQHLKLQTKSQSNNNSAVEIFDINWNEFDSDNKQDFINIGVQHTTGAQLNLPKNIDDSLNIRHGMILEISHLRESWPRKKILDLKAALSKLINPFSGASEAFEIFIHCPAEKPNDQIEEDKLKKAPEYNEITSYHKKINGKVQNFIFETLKSKTTHLFVKIDNDGQSLTSQLIDRDKLIYEIREPNPYHQLIDSNFSCHLYYLNRSAKATFTRQMGVHSVQFGSTFLFRNGFRVFPVGEEGDDTFGLDRRKQQGYARYIGTRDVLGRIDVQGNETHFRESTSRDQGLIETEAYLELKECFWEKCIKRLENYVVGVNWKDTLDAMQEDSSRLKGDKARARVISVVSNLANSKNVELIYYADDLVDILNEKSEDFETSLESLRALAIKTQNPDFNERINRAEKRFQELKEAEALALEKAQKEKEARKIAEKVAREEQAARLKAESDKNKATLAYEEEKKRNLFLSSVSTLDFDNIVNLHHQIGIYSADIHNIIANHIDKLQHNEPISNDELLSMLEQLSFRNQKILSVSRFATKANFRLDSEMIKDDLVQFIEQYIEKICIYFNGGGMQIKAETNSCSLIRSFKPIEISMIIDNLVNNAEKAGATEVSFNIEQLNNKLIEIIVTDDGYGLSDSITEPERIFEKGFSSSSGSGLGLYHTSYILDQMGGNISLNSNYEDGMQFSIKVGK
ncbi:histidine kinase [uncultured Thiomicrorhabdus sp.]